VFVTGINGSGKTRLAVTLARALDRVLIYEPKGDDPEVVYLPNFARVWGAEAALKALPGRVIYHPTAAEMQDPGAHFDRLVEKIWRLGGRHGIAVMETCDLGNARRGFRPWLSLACRQGRFDREHNTGKGITRIFCSQRPVADVPILAKSEAKHYVAFYLQSEDDRRELSKFMGEAVIERTEFTHDYWYSGRASGMQPVRCAAL
jgi:hypothetical protein